MSRAAVAFFLLVVCGCVVLGEKLVPSPCTDPPPTVTDHASYLDSALKQARSDVVYTLEPGEHCIRHHSLLQNLVNLTFQGPALIRCTEKHGMAFYNVTQLSLLQLTIEGCGEDPDNISSFLSLVNALVDLFFEVGRNPEQAVAVMLGVCADFVMKDSSVSGTEGLGLLGINVVNSTLRNVTLEQNVPTGCFSRVDYNFSSEKIGGGAIFYYLDYRDSEHVTSFSSLEIVDSKFLQNSYCGYSILYLGYNRFATGDEMDTRLHIGAGGGFSLILAQFDYSVVASVRSSVFRNNTALVGGGSLVIFFAGVPSSLVTFDKCLFESNGVASELSSTVGYGITGSALSLYKDFLKPNFDYSEVNTGYMPSGLVIKDSVFIKNNALTGTITVFSLFSFVIGRVSQADIVLDNCTIENNSATTGAAIFAAEWKGNIYQFGTNLILNDVSISHNALNTSTFNSASEDLNTGIIVTRTLNMSFTGNNVISHNEGTGIAAIISTVYFTGNTTFLNNSGSYGGGIALSDSSYLVVVDNTTVGFYNNTGAIYGGAIYADSYSTTTIGGYALYDCFITFGFTANCISVITEDCPDITQFDSLQIIFEGNVAPLGNMIYGSTLNSCPWSTTYKKRYAPDRENDNIMEILYQNRDNLASPFVFDTAPDHVEAVSTPTTHITVQLPEKDEPLEPDVSISVAPGIIHRLNITAFDAFNHQVPSVVTSRSHSSTISSRVGGGNYTFLSYNNSQLTDLQIYGDINQTDIDVTLFAVSTVTQVTVKVQIIDCPDGYYLSENETSCLCRKSLVDSKFNCTNDGLIIVPYGSWIGRNQDGELLFGYCPFDFCKPEINIIPMNFSANSSYDYDVQCNYNYNRSGLACGRCAEGYSTIFGSYECRKCSNSFLGLIVLFAAYGILLMLFIILFQFTISEGFLNGILFFSNILTVAGPYYVDATPFVVFYWLSLKVGIAVCFFDGMTALVGTALQFVFPIYLYFLLLVIILLSRWSSRFSRLLHWLGCRGFTPTKLFATIIVMTYSSLLETSIAVLSFTKLRNVETDKVSYHWGYDQSVRYFHGAHAALGVFSCLLLVFFLIPAPFIWMFPSISLYFTRLQRYKPLYDAVWAPLKPRLHFWVSLRLILRVVPLLILNFAPLPTNLLLLCFFLIIMLFLHGVLQPFQGVAQNVVDSIFQAELTYITLLSLFFTMLDLQQNSFISDLEAAMRSNKAISGTAEIQDALILAALISCNVTLVLVVLWHVWKRFPKVKHATVCMWNAVMCKRFHMKQEKKCHATSTVVSINPPTTPTPSYGSTDSDELSTATGQGEVVGLGPAQVATFTELREPLLETSGLAEVYQANTN